jgi:hypothetical protein
MGLINMIALRKIAVRLDYLINTNNDDVLLREFFKPTGKLVKYVRKQIRLNPLCRLSWHETWWYLICRTRIQAILQGVSIDSEELTNKAFSVFASIGGQVPNIRGKWAIYSSEDCAPEARIYTPEATPMERALACARKYIKYICIELAKISAEGCAAGLNANWLNKEQEKKLTLIASNIEKNVTEKDILFIALKTEKLASKICKKIARHNCNK